MASDQTGACFRCGKAGGCDCPAGASALPLAYTEADLAARVEAEREACAALLEPYAESYAAMNRVEPGCRVAAHDVAWDLLSNMIRAIRAIGPTPAYDAAIKAAEARGMEAALACQPSTAEDPNESDYQRGFFDGVMAYGKAIRAAAGGGE